MGKRRSRGGTLVEFTIVAGIFYMILFSIIEFGRLIYTWNVLEEVTRRAARLAAVCPTTDANGIFARATANGSILPDLLQTNLQIDYLDRDSGSTAVFTDIRYVQASIQGYQFQMTIPLVSFFPIPAPPFTTVLPSESLGVIPPGAGNPPSC